MAFFSWTRWLRSLLSPTVKPIRTVRRRTLTLEQLENRLAPATFTWTGHALDNNWMNAANWSDSTNTAPTGIAANGEDLVFPASASQFVTNNNITNGVFNSITFSGGNYTLMGDAITVGGNVQFGVTGQVNLTGVGIDTISLDALTLGGAASGQQEFTVGSSSSLTINSPISNAGGATAGWIKLGTGLMTLTASNIFTEPFTIAQGAVAITNSGALGNTTTTVQQNAQLQLAPVGAATLSVNDALVLSGPGNDSAGALVSVSNANSWLGTVQMSGDTTFGVDAGSLTISGQISDQGSGFNMTKVGVGQLIFNHVGGNTYRGNTTVANGILTIQDPNALGNSPSHTSTTTVLDNSSTQNGVGTLQLDNENPARFNGNFPGFIVANELLILNGHGFIDLPPLPNVAHGALENLTGNNTWTGTVTLGQALNGSTPTIKADSVGTVPTNLLISGAVIDPTGSGNFGFSKTGTGRVILTDVNTFTGAVSVQAGYLNVEDSQALAKNAVSVGVNAELELQLQGDNIFGMIPHPKLDSITGTVNSLTFSNVLGISGTGIPTVVGALFGTGALHSVSGINTWTAIVTLGGAAGIGVDPDPHPSISNAYFIKDYSLTITGNLEGTSLVKVDNGQLVLPFANIYGGTTEINQGWITVQNDQSLGLPNGAQQTQRQYTTVDAGGALQLKPFVPGDNITLTNNFILAGTGTAQVFGLINQAGAIENLDGINTLTGIIQLNGVAGIGVEQMDTGINSQLKLTGSLVDNSAGLKTTTTPNLLQNPDAEAGLGSPTGNDIESIPSWTTQGNFTVVQYGAAGFPAATDPGPVNRGTNFFAGGPNNSSSSASQTIDVSGYAAPIDASKASLTLSGFLGGLAAEGDSATVTATFIDSQGHTLGSTTIGPVLETDRAGLTGLLFRTASTNVPSGTRTIVVTQLMTRLDGTYNDGFADNLSVVLTLPAGIGGLSKLGSQRLILQGPGTYSGPVDVVAGALLDQNSTALGAGGSSTTVEAALPTIQSLSLTASVSQFTLTLGPDTTSPISYTGTAADAGNIAAALNGLAGVLAANGVITVTQTGPGVFIITFGGGLSHADQQLSATVTAGTGIVSVATQRYGGGAALELGVSLPSYSDGNPLNTEIGAGLGVWGEHLILNDTGNTTFNDQAPLVVLSSNSTTVAPFNDLAAFTDADFLWYGPVTLATTVSIEVQPNSRLTIAETIDDAANASPNGSDLTLISGVPGAVSGGGELNLTGTNTYRGTTYINQGTATVANSAALGVSGIATVQALRFTGAPTKFILTFNGLITAAIPYTGVAATDAAAIQSALDALNNVGGTNDLGGFVNVLPAGPGTFNVVFGGSLFGFAQPLMTGAVTTGTGSIGVAIVTTGGGGTIVASGATLQLASSITIAGEPLMVMGQGNATTPTIPSQWFAVGPAPIDKGQDAGNQPVSGRVTGIVTDPTDSNIIYIATAGGGAWKTIDGGKSWRPIFDNIPEIQAISNYLTTGTFTLKFEGQTTAPLPSNATGDQVQTALDNLSTIGGVGGQVAVTGIVSYEIQTVTVTGFGTFTLTFGGQTTPKLAWNSSAVTVQSALNSLSTIRVGGGSVNVTMTPDAAGDSVYTITFTGTFSGLVEPLFVGAGQNGSTVTVVEASQGNGTLYTVTFGGALAGQSLPQIVAVASPAAPTMLTVKTVEVGLDPSFAMYLGAITLDPQNSNIIYIGTGEANNSTDSYYGTGIYKSTDGGITWGVVYGNEQQGAIVQSKAGGQFTLSFTGPDATGTVVTDTTAKLNYNDTSANVANKLNALTNIGGVGGSVTVLQTPIQEIQQFIIASNGANSPTFTITFMGATTKAIAWNASATTVQGDLEALATIGGIGNMVVTYWPLTPAPQGGLTFSTYTLYFSGALGIYQQPLVTTGGFINCFNAGDPIFSGPSVVEVQRGGVMFDVTFGGTLALTTLPLMTATPSGGAAANVEMIASANPFYGKGISQIFPYAEGVGNATHTFLFVADGDSSPGQDEVQQLNIQSIPYTISFTGIDSTGNVVTDTTPLLFTTAAPTIQAALDALSNIGGIGAFVVVNGTKVQFEGTLTNTTVQLMTINAGFAVITTLGVPATVINGTSGAPGIWRLDTAAAPAPWFDMTDLTSPNRGGGLSANSSDAVYGPASTFAGFPYSPGPDDDFRITFPNNSSSPYIPGAVLGGVNVPVQQTNATWTGVQILNSAGPILYASLGTSSGAPNPGNNGVFWSPNPFDASPIGNAFGSTPLWYVGDPFDSTPVLKLDIENGGEFPTGAAGFPINGTIKFSGVSIGVPNKLFGVIGYPNVGFITVYATVTDPFTGALQNIYETTNGGFNWAAIAPPPPTPATYQSGSGWYASTALTIINAARNNTIFFVGGTLANAGASSGQLYEYTAASSSWGDLSDLAGFGPHSSLHALFSTGAGGNLLAGGDGGIWSFNLTTNNWTDLNTNIASSQITGVDSGPTSTATIFATSQNNATEEFTGTQGWTTIDDSASDPLGGPITGGVMGGGAIYVDPSDPNNIYAIQTTLQNDVVLRRSLNGGISWTSVLQNPGPAQAIPGTLSTTVPFVEDKVDPKRLVVGGGTNFGLFLSINQGTSWQVLFPTLPSGQVKVTALAISEYQGAFQSDPKFTGVTDAGANNYDANTLYVTNGSSIALTKNHGINWVDRSIPGVTGGIVDLEVDPRNRDTVYAAVNSFGNQLWESDNAGQTWYEIGSKFGLPAVLAWKLVVDPRNGTLYVGNDLGVFSLVGGTLQDTTTNLWHLFGVGMPNVQIRDLVLNQVTDTLLAGTYGRGVYEMFLDAPQTAPVVGNVPLPIVAPLVALSGAPAWAGPVVLAPDAGPIGVYGNPNAPDPVSTASFNIVGVVSDQLAGSDPTLVKVGGGTLILSGTNTYGGLTDIQQGVIVADNFQALGGTANGTTVELGTALELESSVDTEPLKLFGDGPSMFNGHFTGSLESIANTNTYEGPVTLATNATIGVASGSTLTITGAIGDGNAGFTVTKELVGLLILDDVTTYTGDTYVNQGALQIANTGALNSSAATFVLDGAQIQLYSPEGGPVGGEVTVNEPLSLSGTGINSGGAMLDVSGNNTWAGNITLDANPAFALLSYPLSAVSFAVANFLDTLTISGAIGDETAVNGMSSGLQVVGAGTVALSNSNTYAGSTYVQSGTLKVQNANALAGAASSGATPAVQNEIQRLTYFDPSTSPVTGKFTLSFNGKITGLLPTGIPASGGVGPLASVQNALAALAGIGAGNVSVTMTKVTTPVAGVPLPTFTEYLYTIVFKGALAGVNVSQLVVVTIGGATGFVSTVADGGVGVNVQNGAALALDLVNSPNGQVIDGVALQLNGTGPIGNGALENVSGNATWEGPTIPLAADIPPAITLNTSSAIGVDAGTTLTIMNVAADTTGVTGIDGAAIAALSKIGGGTLLLPTVNHYAGTTQVQNGILNVSNDNSLGQPLSNNVQTLTINGSTGGTFQVTFNGQTTPPITADYTNGTLTRDTLENQLTNLSNIGTDPANGLSNVNVTQDPVNTNVFTITFVGTLAGLDQNALTATSTAGTVITIAKETPGALGYTIVSGGIAVTFQKGLGDAPQAALTVDPSNLLGTTPGIAVATTTVGNTGTNAVQTLYFNGLITGGTFTLSYYNGVTTQTSAQIAWSPDYSVLAANIQAGLDSIVTVGVNNTAVSIPDPGTLQLSGGTAVSNEQLVLTGNGFGGIGALDSLNGANSWDPSSTVFAPNTVPPTSLIYLNGNTSIGVDADAGATPGLTIDQTVAELVNGSQLTKVGAGSMLFSGTTSNTYTGLTTVAAGTLLLDKTGGAIDVPANLTVGLPGGAVPAVARLQQPDQLFTTANVIVNSTGGLFDLNNNTQTINNLTVNNGIAQTGNTGGLTVSDNVTITDGTVQTNNAGTIGIGTGGLLMIGGVVNTGVSGVVTLLGDVTAFSDAATGAATISGTGDLSLGGATRTFTVNAGPAPAGSDMDVQAPIISIAGEGLTKAGAGLLKLDANNVAAGYTGTTTVEAGVLQVAGPNGTIGAALVSGGNLEVDGSAGEVNLSGGTLTGSGATAFTGQVGNIDNGSVGTIPVGTINPGDDTPAADLTGVLTTNAGTGVNGEVWGATTTFAVDLNSAAAGPGAGYDQLDVNGDLNLGGTQIPGGGGNNSGAILAGIVGPGVAIGDSFTIIKATGTISGVFQEPFSNNIAFVGGQKFQVVYSQHTVVITRVRDTATISAVSSANPSVYGQDFVFTATLTPESGVSAPFAAGDTVTFTLRDSTGAVVATGSPAIVGRTATFDGNASGTVPPGTYTLDVAFSGDANYSATSVTSILTQTVKQAGTTVTLAAAPPTPIYGQAVTITATVATNSPGKGTADGLVTFFIDGGAANAANGGFQQTATLPAGSNQVGIVLPTTLTVGSHTITASYSGATDFLPSNTANPQLAVNVAKDPATLAVTASPSTSSVIGQTVTLTATVGNPGPGNPPSGTVTFLDGSNALGASNVSLVGGAYIATLPVSTLALGQHTISATYNGSTTLGSKSAFLNGVTSNNFTVNQISTNVALSLTGGTNPSMFGQTLTFTVAVSAVAPGTGTPGGNVTLYDGSTALNTLTLSAGGIVSFNVSTLTGGSHTITAKYLGSTNYAINTSNALTQVVGIASATTLTASANPAAFGSTVTFTATVTPGASAPAGSPTPTGTVTFLIDGGSAGGGSQSSAITLNAAGVATFPTSSLALGAHSVVAQYTPTGGTYVTSNSTPLNESIQSATTVAVALTTGTNPSVYSQALTFQATVTATAPGAAMPTGNVIFVIDGGPGNGGSQQSATLSGGVASITLPALAVGTHTLTATYGGDTASAPSSTTNSTNQVVKSAPTATLVTSSANPVAAGQPVSFTATVTANAPATAVPTGSVTFVVDNGDSSVGGFQRNVGLNASGKAVLSNVNLTGGPHTVYAVYNNSNVDFSTSTSPTLNQAVVYATTTSLVSSANPAVFGAPVNLTASIAYATGSGTLTGTVDFVDNTTHADLGTANVSSKGVATLQVSNLALGSHSITATYSGNGSFASSVSPTLTQSVLSGSTTTLALAAGSPNASVFSQPITLNVTVAATAPSAPAPTGSVTFYENGVSVGSKTLSSAQASITLASLPVGPDNLTAIYDADTNVGSSTSNTVVETVSKATSTLALALTTGTNPSVYGQNLTFTATVGNVSPATATPTGTVTFEVDGSSVQTVTLSGTTASYSTATLSISGTTPHTIQAVYNGDAGFTGSNATFAGGQTVNSVNGQGFSYDAASKTVTITGTNFTFNQRTSEDAGGNLHSTYYFTIDGVTQAFADTALTRAIVNGHGTAGSAILITNDTYVDIHGVTQETPESISLGSKSDAGVGTMLKYNGTSPFTFLTLSNFPVSYAYVGRNDGTVSLYGSATAAYNGFVSAGNYSYIGGPGLYHEAQGATSVYGYSSGQASDFAYHYAANAGSQYVVSGVAFSYMSCTDQNPDDNNATQSFFNVGVGFLQNTGVAKNPGQDYAYFLDSPGNDTFIGGSAYSYMYIPAPPSPYAEFDVAYGFALVYAQSFVGGTDTAEILDPSHNIETGFNISDGNGRTGT